MNTESVARRLVSLCREGKFIQAQDELFAADARSVENDNAAGSVQGMAAIREKGRNWEATIAELHSMRCSDPLVAGPFFTLTMDLDATYKEGGRQPMSEMCLYEVADGKIVREQFFYKMS